MRIEELRLVCEEAARNLVASKDRPFNPTVVLPGRERTRLVELAPFPTDPHARRELLAHFANDELLEGGVPCYGFLAEAEIGEGDEAVDVLLVVYGARRHHPMVTAAGLGEDGLATGFEEPEELDPEAFPFLHPLQRAVDSLEPEQAPPTPGEDALPIFGDR